MSLQNALWDDLQTMRSQRPLIYNITNNVVTNVTANALLALGASPAMSHTPQESDELTKIASALVINIGTPDVDAVQAIMKAGKTANDHNIPIVLDPVAAGATSYRRTLLADFLAAVSVSVIRGNASEILSLVHSEAHGKGVDSTHSGNEAIDEAVTAAKQYKCTVCISGEQDIITNGSKTTLLGGGSPMMTLVTGMGCTATSLIGAFLAVNKDAHAAAVHAMAVMNIAGEIAAQTAQGPGTLQLHFYDILYKLDFELISKHLRVLQA
jgi:hydroxyethylthiazole kinase